eukprot:jgi/Bigna1/80297/fgenesh1_pg.69_\
MSLGRMEKRIKEVLLINSFGKINDEVLLYLAFKALALIGVFIRKYCLKTVQRGMERPPSIPRPIGNRHGFEGLDEAESRAEPMDESQFEDSDAKLVLDPAKNILEEDNETTLEDGEQQEQHDAKEIVNGFHPISTIELLQSCTKDSKDHPMTPHQHSHVLFLIDLHSMRNHALEVLLNEQNKVKLVLACLVRVFSWATTKVTIETRVKVRKTGRKNRPGFFSEQKQGPKSQKVVRALGQGWDEGQSHGF